VRAPRTRRKPGHAAVPPTLSVRLLGHVALDMKPDGMIGARVGDQTVPLGRFGAPAATCARSLSAGIAWGSVQAGTQDADTELQVLVRRLAMHGLLEYHLSHPATGAAMVVIEPQTPDYVPRTPLLGEDDAVCLSRFAFLRRRGAHMVLESPRSRAVLQLCDTAIAGFLAGLSTPQKLSTLRGQTGFPGDELIALLIDSEIVFSQKSARAGNSRLAEGDQAFALWDFHDLLFHTRSTQGRHANPSGGLYPYVGVIPPLPAVRPSWPGKKIDLHEVAGAAPHDNAPIGKLLRDRHSLRVYDNEHPITLVELAHFLGSAARVQSRWTSEVEPGDADGAVDYAARPYPSGGGCWELELYLAVDRCDGLPRGFYHYDAGDHALVPIAAREDQLDAMLGGAQYAMGAPASPQVLVTIAARFGRISWKYSSFAYSLVLKDAGVLIQTLYLVATGMGLGGCAVGSSNIELFAKMTGLDFHVEGPVGVFALGRGPDHSG